METFDLVFEGGGAKGVAFIGALDVLQRSGHTTRRLIGSSAGAITATCVAAGFTPAEMLELAKEKRNQKAVFKAFLEPPVADDFSAELREQSDFNRLLKDAFETALKSEPVDQALKKLPALVQPAVKVMVGQLKAPLLTAALNNNYGIQLFALSETGGLFRDERFLNWLCDRLKQKGLPEAITLKSFHEKTSRDLTLAVTDTTDRELLLLNQRTAPDCPLVAAVRMSMGIPFVWPEVVWRKEWGLYRGKPKAGHFMVDGGTLSNFPLRYLVDGNAPGIRDIMGPPDAKKVRNLGLLLDETRALPTAAPAPAARPFKLIERISRTLDTVISAQDQEIIDRYADIICRIGVKGVDILEFDMSDERLEAVVNAGRCAMTDYLKTNKLKFE